MQRQNSPANFDKKWQARRFGLWAEALACGLLLAKGYRIRARNYKVKGGEIDIIAVRGDVVAFVEVKARPQLDMAATAINFAKTRRISVAARVWLGRNRWAAGSILRGDAIYVAPFSWPRHLIAAYQLSM